VVKQESVRVVRKRKVKGRFGTQNEDRSAGDVGGLYDCGTLSNLFLVAMHAMARHAAGAFEIIKGSKRIRIPYISQRTTPTRQRNNIWQDTFNSYFTSTRLAWLRKILARQAEQLAARRRSQRETHR